MVIPTQKSRFNVLHISDDDENDDATFTRPKTRKNTRPIANMTKSKKTVDVPFLVPNQPKKTRAKKPIRSKQENDEINGIQEKTEEQNVNGEARDVGDNDEDLNKALRESEETYHLEKMVRDISIVEDDDADKPPLTRREKAKEKNAKEKRSKNIEHEIPQTLSDVASVLTRVKLESETQEYEYFDAAQFDSNHYEKILAKKEIEIEEHKSLADRYKARFRRVLALINECEYKDIADLSIECDQLKKSIAEYIKIQEELMSQISEANKEIEQLKSRNHDLEKEYSRKYQK